MKKLLEKKLRPLLAFACAVAGFATTASAAPSPVMIYKVTTVSRNTDIRNDAYNRSAEKQGYFLIVDRNASRYRTVKLFSGKKYRNDDETKSFSQSFVSRDAANRERLVLSVKGPGLEWDFFDGAGSSHATLETVIGRMKRIRSAVSGADLEMLMPTTLKGTGRREYSNTARDSRFVTASKSTMRFSRRLTRIANSNGGGFGASQVNVVEYLEARGWTNLFAQ